MARHAGLQWNLPDGKPSSDGRSNVHSWDSIHAALLMDVRDELQRLNEIFRCANFLEIPRTLREIKRNTTRKKKTTAARRKRP